MLFSHKYKKVCNICRQHAHYCMDLEFNTDIETCPNRLYQLISLDYDRDGYLKNTNKLNILNRLNHFKKSYKYGCFMDDCKSAYIVNGRLVAYLYACYDCIIKHIGYYDTNRWNYDIEGYFGYTK